MIQVRKKEVLYNENDIPTKENIPCKGSWFQTKNEYGRRQKSLICKKSKGKKKDFRLGRIIVTFSSIILWRNNMEEKI